MTAERSPLQRCRHYVPGIRSQPWWEGVAFPIVSMLEENYTDITDEFENILLCGRLRLHPQSKGGPGRTITDGDWNMFDLFSHGALNQKNAIEAPITANLLSRTPDICTHPRGLAYFSVLSPQVHIGAHCGSTNTRIRVHLGIRVPKGAVMRVGAETRVWKEGECLIFDDSWEHEVFNRSDLFRAVLLFDIWHPDLTPEQRREQIKAFGATSTVGANREWYRTLVLDDRSLGEAEIAVNYADVLNTLGTDRFYSIMETADKVRESAIKFVSASAKLVLAAKLGMTELEKAAADRVPDGVYRARLWHYLVELMDGDVGGRLTQIDVINLIHIFSLYWLTNRGNVGLMGSYVDCWTAVDKRAALFELTKSSSVMEMLRCLAVNENGSGSPPFGAMASVAVIATKFKFRWHRPQRM